MAAVVADATHPRAVRVGDYVQVVPTSPLASGIGYLRQVLEVFVLEGVAFAVLTPKETTIPPIVPVDELARFRLASKKTRRTTAPGADRG